MLCLALFSWDSHFIASTHTLLSSYYSLIVGHMVNRRTKNETDKNVLWHGNNPI